MGGSSAVNNTTQIQTRTIHFTMYSATTKESRFFFILFFFTFCGISSEVKVIWSIWVQVLKVQLLALPLDHHLLHHMTSSLWNGCLKMCTSENVLGIEVAYLFELRSEICCACTWVYCSSFELQRKSGLLVSSEKYWILLFFGGKYVRNTTFDFMLVKVWFLRSMYYNSIEFICTNLQELDKSHLC